jgi:hypothetical protein
MGEPITMSRITQQSRSLLCKAGETGAHLPRVPVPANITRFVKRAAAVCLPFNKRRLLDETAGYFSGFNLRSCLDYL